MFGRFRPNPPQCSGDSGQTPPMLGRFRPGRKATNIGAPSVRAISAKTPPMFGRFRPNPPQCSGDSGQTPPQCWGDFGQAEKPRTLGPPVFGRFRPKPPQCSGDFGQTPPNVRAIPAKPPPMLGRFRPGRKARNIGGQIGRNRPNIGGPSVRGFSAWPKSPEHWGPQCS